uniref:Uncharacterized protein n=1 Tax=Chromera velia CCMP2878 TaxID=1169474 RepID=A0A0G4H938_9ALVE|eukprot:Cvel_25201.t1-p1 / transcript=Cvel_25201.t1 / gene=Cvel_25201 / organism=Chromera_velia_CCMP2878 / gene_product=hypothetical protein / transcript_product=hypothetical protein / location=Cvel_scaffold2823:12160-13017(+) / protein_length=286 / sequence_SO=supercontig / SO=protein_coding / is_pseudo=false
MSVLHEMRSTVDALQQACLLPSAASMDQLEDYYINLAVHAHNSLSLLFRSCFVVPERVPFSWEGKKRSRGKRGGSSSKKKSEATQPEPNRPASSFLSLSPRSNPDPAHPIGPCASSRPLVLTNASSCFSDGHELTPPVTLGLSNTNPDRSVRENLPVALSSLPKEKRRQQKKERRAVAVSARSKEENLLRSPPTAPTTSLKSCLKKLESNNLGSGSAVVNTTPREPPDPPKEPQLIPVIKWRSHVIPDLYAVDTHLRCPAVTRAEREAMATVCSPNGKDTPYHSRV